MSSESRPAIDGKKGDREEAQQRFIANLLEWVMKENIDIYGNGTPE